MTCIIRMTSINGNRAYWHFHLVNLQKIHLSFVQNFSGNIATIVSYLQCSAQHCGWSLHVLPMLVQVPYVYFRFLQLIKNTQLGKQRIGLLHIVCRHYVGSMATCPGCPLTCAVFPGTGSWLPVILYWIRHMMDARIKPDTFWITNASRGVDKNVLSLELNNITDR